MIKYFNKKNIISGAIIFGIGDSIGSFILNEFSWLRLIGLTFIGGAVYAIEIPIFFDWLEAYSKKFSLKTALPAIMCFNRFEANLTLLHIYWQNCYAV